MYVHGGTLKYIVRLLFWIIAIFYSTTIVSRGWRICFVQTYSLPYCVQPSLQMVLHSPLMPSPQPNMSSIPGRGRTCCQTHSITRQKSSQFWKWDPLESLLIYSGVSVLRISASQLLVSIDAPSKHQRWFIVGPASAPTINRRCVVFPRCLARLFNFLNSPSPPRCHSSFTGSVLPWLARQTAVLAGITSRSTS